MARTTRIECKNGWYWVSNRAVDGQTLFTDERQYRFFLNLLSQLGDRFQVELHGYCLLADEYHLLLRTRHANLAACMRYLQSLYAQFRKRGDHFTGSVFRGRYRSLIFQPQRYLLKLSALLHQLPHQQGIQFHPADYPWSSCAAFVDDHQLHEAMAPDWLERTHTYQLLGGDRERYRLFLSNGPDSRLLAIYQHGRWPRVLGDDEFHRRLRQHLRQQQGTALTSGWTQQRQITVERVIETVCQIMQVSWDEMMDGRRGRLNLARMMAIYLCHCEAQQTLLQVARHFDLNHFTSVSSAIRRYQKLREEQSDLRSREYTVREQLRQWRQRAALERRHPGMAPCLPVSSAQPVATAVSG
ncbi:MAG: hypothetical protein Tsb002_10740 [Wenzhouxiangellaceae bacterium]